MEDLAFLCVWLMLMQLFLTMKNVTFGEQLCFSSCHNLYIQCLLCGLFFLSCSYTASEVDASSDRTPEQRALLVESRR